MNEGDVILALIPQADGVEKNRPALILREMPPFGDMLVCGISTQIHCRGLIHQTRKRKDKSGRRDLINIFLL